MRENLRFFVSRKSKKFSKKSIAIDMLLVLLIGAFAALVLFILVPRLLGQETTETSNLISSTKDYDNDGVQDYFDKCDCEYGDARNDGCPAGLETSGDVAIIREKECNKKKK